MPALATMGTRARKRPASRPRAGVRTHGRATLLRALFCLSSITLLVTAAGAQSDTTCENDPRRRALDFLIGSWGAVGASGDVEGEVVVERALGGCLLVETSRAIPEGGESIGYWHFDPAAKLWRVTRVDGEGRSYRLEGTAGSDEISVQGNAVEPDGADSTIRGTRRLLADGRIEQRWETSDDGGRSWQELWRGHYVRAGTRTTSTEPAPSTTQAPVRERARLVPPEPVRTAPAPSPPPRTERARAPEEAPATAAARPPAAPDTPAPRRAEQPAQTGEVAARSLEPPDAPEPREERSAAVEELTPRDAGPRRDPIRMASPMQLQVPIGPVEKLPEGYGWTTRDTGAYQVDDVRLERISVARERRRGNIQLEVELQLVANDLLTNVGVTVELLDAAGGVLQSADLGRFPLGKSLTEQSQYGFVTKTSSFSLEASRFDELFGAEARPQLRITLTTGGSR